MEKQIATYVTMLSDSLKNKAAVLDDVIALNRQELEMLQPERMDFTAFDKSMEEKGTLIEKLNSLDDGFEALYGRIRDEIQSNRTAYADRIRLMQQQIRDITDKNVTIQAQEARIKAAVELQSNRRYQEFRQKRDKTVAVENYYQTMNNLHSIGPQFMDQKK